MEKKKKIALIVANNEKSLLLGGVLLLRKLDLKSFKFDPKNDCFVAGAETLERLDLKSYDLILVSDPSNHFTMVSEFLIRHYRKEIIWLCGSHINHSRFTVIKNAVGEKNLIKGVALSTSLPNSDFGNILLDLEKAIVFLENKKKDFFKPLILTRLEKALKIARLQIKLETAKPELISSVLKEFLVELLSKKDNPLIVSLLIEYKKAELNKKALRKQKVKHYFLGSIKIIEAEKENLIDKSMIYQKALKKSNGVALAIKEDCYELCLRKNLAEKFGDEIPAIKRINGCRFIVHKNFLFSESEKV